MSSRGDFGSSVGYQQAPSGRDGEAEYTRLSNEISNNIQTFKKQVNSLKRIVDQIGTEKDGPGLLDDFRDRQSEAGRIAKDTSNYLTSLGCIDSGIPQEQKQRKIQQDKLTDSFSSILNEFQRIQRLAAEKEKATVKRARAVSVENYESTRQQELRQEGGPQMQVQTESELSLEDIKDREAKIRQLESDILDVNDIFKDLALMVHEQGDMIDSIESNVVDASAHVERGNVQLEKARDYQKASRRKLCCVVVILIIVLAIVGIIIYFAVKK